MKKKERRRKARIKIHLFTVVRKIMKSKGLSRPHIAFTRDISSDGLYFYTRMKTEAGDHLCLSVYFVSDAQLGGTTPRLEGIGSISRIDSIHKELPLSHLNGVAVQFAHELAVTF